MTFLRIQIINGKCDCGKRKSRVSTRIIGGRPTRITKYPWQVQVVNLLGQVCGGTIIAREYVLTAGHCVYRNNKPLKPKLVIIRAGNSTLGWGKLKKVSRIFGHGYKDNCDLTGCTKLKNDIAILKLTRPVKFGKSIQPVCLPSKGNEYPYPAGTKCIATGFGRTKTNGNLSKILREVELRTLSKSKIKKYDLWSGFIYTHNQKKGTCMGDSGGPLVMERNKR